MLIAFSGQSDNASVTIKLGKSTLKSISCSGGRDTGYLLNVEFKGSVTETRTAEITEDATALYIKSQLKKAGFSNIQEIDESTGDKKRGIIKTFAPYYKSVNPKTIKKEDEIKLLIATDVLAKYLKSREVEIMDIMTALFDEDEVYRRYAIRKQNELLQQGKFSAYFDLIQSG